MLMYSCINNLVPCPGHSPLVPSDPFSKWQFSLGGWPFWTTSKSYLSPGFWWGTIGNTSRRAEENEVEKNEVEDLQVWVPTPTGWLAGFSTENYSSCCRPSPIASMDTSCLFSPWVVIGLLTLPLFTFINSPLLSDPQLLHFSMSFVFYRTLADNTTQLDYNVSWYRDCFSYFFIILSTQHKQLHINILERTPDRKA